jgi:hypothetical protein
MILAVGDTSKQLATWTINKFGSGQLVDSSNYNSLVDAVYFTALGDLNFDQIKSLALSAEEVYFVADLPWNDQAALTSTQILCNHISQFKTVIGFTKKDSNLFLTVPVARNYNNPTLWTFGCSHTEGTGLYCPEKEVYGKLLADKLGMPWQNVAKCSTSTRWSLAHLLQAELKPNDIVIWGTTGPERLRVAENSIKDKLLKDASRSAVEYYTDEQIVFEHLDFVNSGVKYLQATNIKFILLGLFGPAPYFQKLELEFSGHKEWCPALDWMEHDRGNDGIHMGPIGHTKLANRIYNHIQLLEYDKSI